jgi:8-oxo-dGTP pyrophosphatase MutT (NUDIX family)
MDKLKEKGTLTTCPIAMIIKDGKILAGLRNYTKDKWKVISVWTAPGGRCDENETVEETLKREVSEEIGVNDLEIIKFLGEVPGAKEGDNVLVYLCFTNSEPKLMEPEKFTEWKWFSLEEYKQGVPTPYINEEVRKLVVKENL